MLARSLCTLVALAVVAAVSPAEAQSAKKGSGKKGSGKKPAAMVGVGDKAPTVALPSLSGEPIDLAETFADGKTVLVVLRGFPGYQCPVCSRQVNDYTKMADRFAEAGVDVVLVYPGAAAQLGAKATEFLADRQLPNPVTMVLDPDYALVNAYGLRWDAPRETAYPSTFVVGEGGAIEWATVSKTHGGRVAAAKALAAATK